MTDIGLDIPQLLDTLKEEIADEVESLARIMAREFIDVTLMNTPAGVRLLKHTLTGRTLRVTAEWIEP